MTRRISGIIHKINENKGFLSHHNGVGQLMAPFMESHLGNEQMEVLRMIRK
ncbi:MAG: hypothetical protein RBR67_15290 [Desulfobacterium sp.]|nr:hypothetical protein [Desulfobacterium sp.]